MIIFSKMLPAYTSPAKIHKEEHPHLDHFILMMEYKMPNEALRRETWIFYNIEDLPTEIRTFSNDHIADSLWYIPPNE